MILYDGSGNAYWSEGGKTVPYTGQDKPGHGPEGPSWHPVAGGVESVLQGVTGGSSDEIQAGLHAVQGLLSGRTKGLGDAVLDYAQHQDMLHQATQRHNEDYFWPSLAGNVSGGLFMGGAAPGLAGQYLPKVAQWAKNHPVISPVLAGTGFGAGAGAASSRAGERGKGAAIGATAGAALGSIFGAGFGIGGWLNRKFGGTLNQAQSKFAQALADDGFKLETRAERDAFEQYLRRINPDDMGMLADVGENTQALASVAGQVPGPQLREATETLRNRSNNAYDDMAEALDIADGSMSAHKTIEQVEALRSLYAKPFYHMAWENGVRHNRALEGVWNQINHYDQKLWGRARQTGEQRLMNEFPNNPDKIAYMLEQTAKDGTRPSLRGWDSIKRQLYDEAQRLRAQSRDGTSDAANQLDTLRIRLVDELDRQNKHYKLGRQVWEDASTFKNDIEKGMKFQNAPDSVSTHQLEKMTPVQRDALRIGFKTQLLDKLSSQGDWHDITKIFTNRTMRRKLQKLYGREAYNNIIETVERQRRRQSTLAATTAGSQTFRRQEAASERGAVEVPTAAGVVATGHPLTAVTSAAGQMVRSAAPQTRIDRKVAQDIGQIGFETDLAKQLAMIRLLGRRQGQRQHQGPLAGGVTGGLTASLPMRFGGRE